uniref:Menorin-like domain-containing protein n=1 Tax=Globisporangium ultimum (strain ATCC 200006 / CBS 805.95 / DAOM BR144) TaxID=431595 RepID=K3WAA0_GLOUD
MASTTRKPLDYRWAHAVNSHALLGDVVQEICEAQQTAFSSKSYVNAIEADIIWSDAQQIAVMGHPPQVDGELSFAAFLDAMQKLARLFTPHEASFGGSMADGSRSSSPLIVKLDFKSMQAFRASYEHLRMFIAAFPYAGGVFVNADILVGPATTSDIAFQAREFLDAASALASIDGANAHKLVLSVGWTTSNAIEEEYRRGYTHEMVDAMLDVLKPYSHLQVTFPIRATSVRNSWEALQKLLTGPRNYGFTLWWAKTQIPDEELEWLYATFEEDVQAKHFADRTFYDILGFERFLQQRFASTSAST